MVSSQGLTTKTPWVLDSERESRDAANVCKRDQDGDKQVWFSEQPWWWCWQWYWWCWWCWLLLMIMIVNNDHHNDQHNDHHHDADDWLIQTMSIGLTKAVTSTSRWSGCNTQRLLESRDRGGTWHHMTMVNNLFCRCDFCPVPCRISWVWCVWVDRRE